MKDFSHSLIQKENPKRKMWSYKEAKQLFAEGKFEILSISETGLDGIKEATRPNLSVV